MHAAYSWDGYQEKSINSIRFHSIIVIECNLF